MGPNKMTHPVSLAPLLFRRSVVADQGGFVGLPLGAGVGGGGEGTGAEGRSGHGTGDGSGVGIGIACMCSSEWIGWVLWC